jgi:RimJ/RimL family protein N-acetyltransferase
MTFLRPATLRDADTLFAWRNDPVTQACFRSTAPVPREDHDQWMQFNVAQGYPEHLVMIVEDENLGSVGVIRFDADRGDVMSYNASITMAPRLRGRGMARAALAQACGYMHEYAINAEIRKSNIRSRKIFRQCGFEPVTDEGDFVTYRREPL